MGADGAEILALVTGRRGHFRMESGLHAALWLDLDPLFADARRIEPFVGTLADAIRSHDVAAVCGPLVGGAFLAQLLAERMGVDFAHAERIASPRDGLFRAEYRVPPALGARLAGRRVAIVDDVMSAGSSLRATHTALTTYGAIPVVVGALLVLGSAGASYFEANGLPVVSAGRAEHESWTPNECPLCRGGVPLEELATIV
jgi:orotate phosphoribosyltransferase